MLIQMYDVVLLHIVSQELNIYNKIIIAEAMDSDKRFPAVCTLELCKILAAADYFPRYPAAI